MTTVKLPALLKPIFWDYPFTQLSWKTDRELIIRRVLANGSWDTIVWLWKKMGTEALRKWLIANQAKGLDPRRIRFWELMLDLPPNQVEEWLKTARGNPWEKR